MYLEPKSLKILVNQSRRKFRTDIIYSIGIAYVNICLVTNTLQVIYTISNAEHNIDNYILVNYPVDSPAFYKFLNTIYPIQENEIIELNFDEITYFCGYGKICYINDRVEIDFDSLEYEATPVNSLHYKLYDPENA